MNTTVLSKRNIDLMIQKSKSNPQGQSQPLWGVFSDPHLKQYFDHISPIPYK